jgi:hypothetical protein
MKWRLLHPHDELPKSVRDDAIDDELMTMYCAIDDTINVLMAKKAVKVPITPGESVVDYMHPDHDDYSDATYRILGSFRGWLYYFINCKYRHLVMEVDADSINNAAGDDWKKNQQNRTPQSISVRSELIDFIVKAILQRTRLEK